MRAAAISLLGAPLLACCHSAQVSNALTSGEVRGKAEVEAATQVRLESGRQSLALNWHGTWSGGAVRPYKAKVYVSLNTGKFCSDECRNISMLKGLSPDLITFYDVRGQGEIDREALLYDRRSAALTSINFVQAAVETLERATATCKQEKVPARIMGMLS